MRRRGGWILGLSLLLGAFAGAEGETRAAPLSADWEKLRLAPPAARLLMLLDVQSLSAQADFEPLWTRLLSLPQAADALAKLNEALGFEPRRDLRKVMFAQTPGVKDSEFILLEGRFDTARAQELLLLLGAAPDAQGTALLYALPDKDNPEKLNYLSFLRPDLLAVGRREAVAGALEALNEPRDPAAARGIPRVAGLLAALPEAGAVKVALDDLASLPGDKDPLRPVLRSLALTLLLPDGRFQARLAAECRDETAAQRVREVAEGGLALAQLFLDRKPAWPPFCREMLDAVRFNRDGTRLQAELELPSAAVAAALLQALELRLSRVRQDDQERQVGPAAAGPF